MFESFEFIRRSLVFNLCLSGLIWWFLWRFSDQNAEERCKISTTSQIENSLKYLLLSRLNINQIKTILLQPRRLILMEKYQEWNGAHSVRKEPDEEDNNDLDYLESFGVLVTELASNLFKNEWQHFTRSLLHHHETEDYWERLQVTKRESELKSFIQLQDSLW